MGFMSLVSANLALIFVSRSRSQTFAAVIARPNRIYWWIVIAAGVALIIAVYVPSVASLFQFAAADVPSMGIVAVGSSGLVLLSGLVLRHRQ